MTMNSGGLMVQVQLRDVSLLREPDMRCSGREPYSSED